jgi:Zn-dependent metalloprotease
MRRWCRSVLCVVVVVIAALPGVHGTRAQGEARAVLSIAVGAGSPRASVADVDARIARMLSAGQLARTHLVPDALGRNRRHEYFTQLHQGVPVIGAGLSRQVADGLTVSVFGTLFLGIDITVGPRLAVDTAMTTMRAMAGTASTVPGADVSLVILPQFDGSYRLTYRTTFDDGRTRFLDAVSGDLVRVEDAFVYQRSVGTGEGAHGDRKKVSAVRSGGGYEAIDLFRPSQIRTLSTQGTNLPFEQLFGGVGTVAQDTDNTWANTSVVDAHVNTGLAYDYFSQRMAWHGLDGANARIDQVVTDAATIEDNAFFSPPGSSASNVGLMAFGMSSAGYPMASLDVVGHEAMHGVTFFSLRRRTGAGLRSVLIPDGFGPTRVSYRGQTLNCSTAFLRFVDGSTAPFLCDSGRYVLTSNHGGAVNEGFSDVFGTAIEWRFQPGGTGALRADYTVGEDTVPGGPAAAQLAGLFRSLAEPTSVPFEPTGVIRHPDHVDRRVRYTLYVRNNQVFAAPWAIVNDEFVNVSTDSGGVHANATIMGHVFYRAIEGGVHGTSGLAVAGVGAANRELIEKVFFRAVNQLMPGTVTFQTTAAALRQAAVDLHGASSPAYRAIDESLLAAGL